MIHVQNHIWFTYKITYDYATLPATLSHEKVARVQIFSVSIKSYIILYISEVFRIFLQNYRSRLNFFLLKPLVEIFYVLRTFKANTQPFMSKTPNLHKKKIFTRTNHSHVRKLNLCMKNTTNLHKKTHFVLIGKTHRILIYTMPLWCGS